MGNFFNLDGPFYKYGNMLADLLLLSLMWLLFSIPVLTIGASTTALFYVATRRLSNKEGYVARDFFKSFKKNLVPSSLAWLLVLGMLLLLANNILNADLVEVMPWIVWVCQFAVLFEVLIVSVFLFPVIARFDMKLWTAVKSAFFMANRHLLTSVACLAVGVFLVFMVAYSFGLIFIAMGVYGFIASYLIMRIFKKYRPEIDRDPDVPIN